MYINPNIKKTERKFPEQNRYGKLRYDMNENPEGLPKDFVDSVLKEINSEFLAIYPEPDKFLIKYSKYASEEYGIKLTKENLMATNGSDMAIRYLLETFGEPGKEVVTVSPSFEMYWVNCNLLGLIHKPVSYNDDLTINIANIIDSITENTRIVVLLNPNNPVGNVYTDEEVESIVSKANSVGAVVIIDEAYHYFCEKTFINLIEKNNNVIITRTFSKAFSLAACRLGVIISNPELIHYVTNSKLTFDVNSIALLFGEKLIDNINILKKMVEDEKEGKEWLLKELTTKGYSCRDCTGNFIFIKTKNNAQNICKKLEEKNILVHAYGNELLKDYLRVSVGSKKAMEPFLSAFLETDN